MPTRWATKAKPQIRAVSKSRRSARIWVECAAVPLLISAPDGQWSAGVFLRQGVDQEVGAELQAAAAAIGLEVAPEPANVEVAENNGDPAL